MRSIHYVNTLLLVFLTFSPFLQKKSKKINCIDQLKRRGMVNDLACPSFMFVLGLILWIDRTRGLYVRRILKCACAY